MNLNDQLIQAIKEVFATTPANLYYPTSRIRKIICRYLCMKDNSISDPDLICALRQSGIAFPQPTLRSNSHIRWRFETSAEQKNRVTIKPIKKKQRQYKYKSIAASQKLNI